MNAKIRTLNILENMKYEDFNSEINEIILNNMESFFMVDNTLNF